MRRHNMRISRMVLTWGPGAILESREGPRIILREHGLTLPPGISLEDLRISSPELETLLSSLTGHGLAVRIFQVPGTGIFEGVSWRTKPFPEWRLCVEHQMLYRGRCPECRKENRSPRNAGKEAIRFVRACPAGHLDDVDWDVLVHGNNPPHRSDYYRWESRGPGLRDIWIRCPLCGRSRSLGEAYGEAQTCSGRFPEREAPDEQPRYYTCHENAYILQRQASNLRVPEILSLFTVPPRFTRLHQLLEKVKDSLIPELLLDENGNLMRDNFEKTIREVVRQKKLTQAESEEIQRCPEREIAQAIRDVTDHRPVEDLSSMLLREFHTFLEGASQGIPPVRGEKPHSRVLLEINPSLSRVVGPFRVVPVSRLRLVTVQTGYRRYVGQVGTRLPDLVDISITDKGGVRWFPGYESMGEGLFITLAETEMPPAGEAARRWMEVRSDLHSHDPRLFRGSERGELHPSFVAWHTLSHLIIRALAVDSGYSSPSIRERVYLEEMPDGRVRGGVLIYTATRSGDGSMGGLLVLADYFERILERVREMARSCSADPLCQEHRFQQGEVLGAACHACCLISETSCEHRNFWLDRNVLLETGWL